MDQGTAPSMVSSPSPGPPASGTPAPAAKPSADNAKVTQFGVSVARSASRYRQGFRWLGGHSCDFTDSICFSFIGVLFLPRRIADAAGIDPPRALADSRRGSKIREKSRPNHSV
jgi:hypothetical protein